MVRVDVRRTRSRIIINSTGRFSFVAAIAVETVERMADGAVWSVYIQHTEPQWEWMADCKDQATAIAIKQAVEDGKLGQRFA